jgi:hypothetical protein
MNDKKPFETILKPILEKTGVYNGNDVSAREIYEKYLAAFPDGIRPLWKFQIIAAHETNIFVKSKLFEGNDEIYVFSGDPPPEDTVKRDWKEVFLSGYIGRIYSILNDEELVDHWLYAYEGLYDEFEDPKNKLFLYARQHEKIARYWLRHGEHNSASADPIIIRGQKMWDQFVKDLVHWESKAGAKHTVRRWLC